jgi:hypothetical protein
MSVPEIGFRTLQYVQKKKEKQRLQGFFPDDKRLLRLPEKTLPIGKLDFTLKEQEIDIFGQVFRFDQPIDWHLDIASGKRFPLSFAKDINIRTEEYGSAKHVWEVNRMQFLTLIALQYRQTSDEKYLQQFQEIMESWFEANPYLLGVNWYSNIEVNIRLIVWFFCWEILDVNQLMQDNQPFKAFVEEQWVPFIYLHMRYSAENPSRYSSANNHLISEHAGLFVAACFWQFEESAQWLRHAQQGLEQEIIAQHSASGVNLEEAAEYIQFITDFFLIPLVVGTNADRPFSPAYHNRLESIFNYIFHMMDLKGNIVYYGDEDDGKVVILDDDIHHDNFKSLLTSGVVLFGNGYWKSQDAGFDTKNAILFGEPGRENYEKVASEETNTTSRFFLDEGHLIMRRQDRKAGKEMFVHFDAAPLGFLSIAAHGHADALSFVLHVDGYPVITDPGTYTYHTEADWRKYFLSTLAHNTVCVDGQNQAMIAGPTMWLRHYQSKVISQETNEQEDMILATHNGYEKLGVNHQRRLHLNKNDEVLSITDQLLCSKQLGHLVQLPFHLHPDVEVVQVDAHVFDLQHPAARTVRLELPQLMDVTLFKGKTDPIMGWYSPSFQVKMPTSVILGNCNIPSTTEFETRISIKP